jgi:hypothetical protein
MYKCACAGRKKVWKNFYDIRGGGWGVFFFFLKGGSGFSGGFKRKGG